ncbi:serine hydrolase [Paenibacillus sp. OAE614]|uniref:serine hydrolase n=1 Tax=Paenibacillus sp. OAE614 TaxID=2663804 RepID=UPI00178965FA
MVLVEPARSVNAGYILLAYILEKISYEDYLRTYLLDPLSMYSTGCDNFRTILKDRASGYSMWGEVSNTEILDMSTAHGAGNLYSTVKDLFYGIELYLKKNIYLLKNLRDFYLTHI